KYWLETYNDYIPTNAEMPLQYLSLEESNKYMKTFECEFGKYVYKFIPNRTEEDMKKFLSNLIDNIEISDQKHIVTNLGKKEYRDALVSVIPSRGIHFQAYDDEVTGGYQFKLHQVIQNKLFNELYLDFLSEQDSTIEELRVVAKKYSIPDPQTKINVKRYYLASICKRFKVPFLMLGDTGVGKSYFVNSIISKSERKKYAEINCATLSGELFRSELFGHKKGAFTGATTDKVGYLTQYKDGIIFLDEIGEISLKDQAKILTFLDSKRYSPVGSVESLNSNVYLIFATNQNLKNMCKKGTFRWDLYYRITQTIITIPSFQELSLRKKEIILQKIQKNCNDLLRSSSLSSNKVTLSRTSSTRMPQYLSKALGEDAIYFILYEYRWPGNLREIFNTVLKSFMFSHGNEISRNKLKLYLDIIPEKPSINPFNFQFKDIDGKNAKTLAEEFQNRITKLALNNYNGNQAKAARAIGLSSQTFGNWVIKAKKTE
ncbi:sigma 54-interacting transcriptional regulator, partial [Candidatus Cloacimonadota bacterium]